MRKAFLVLIPLLIWGCEQTYDNVIDTTTENYQVSNVAGIKDTIDLRKEPSDFFTTIKQMISSYRFAPGYYWSLLFPLPV